MTTKIIIDGKIANKTTKKVIKFLRKYCPFFYEAGWPNCWHGTFCCLPDNSGKWNGYDAHCSCVWHLTDRCILGEWNFPFKIDNGKREIELDEKRPENQSISALISKIPKTKICIINESVNTNRKLPEKHPCL